MMIRNYCRLNFHSTQLSSLRQLDKSQQSSALLFAGEQQNHSTQYEGLTNRTIIVTSSELSMPRLGITSQAGGMAIAASQIAESLCEDLGMKVKVIVPAVKCMNIAGWHKELTNDQLIPFEIKGNGFGKKTLYFQIYSSKILLPWRSSSGTLQVYAIKQVDKDGKPLEKCHDTSYFGFNDFNFRTPESRSQGAKLYEAREDADALKAGALYLWNDLLVQAIDRLPVPDAIMFSNYADNELPELLRTHTQTPQRYRNTALLQMMHAELGGPEAGEVHDNLIANNTPYPTKSLFQWLHDSIKQAHVTLINPNYASFLAGRYERFYGLNPVSPLLKKISYLMRGSDKPLHLGLNGFDPSQPLLEDSQVNHITFQPLNGKVPNQITPHFLKLLSFFKNANKQNLYTMLENLPKDANWSGKGGRIIGTLNRKKDSKIFTYFDRIDSIKGTQSILDTIPQVLNNPESSAQFIIASGFTKADELMNSSFYRQIHTLAAEFPGRFAFIQGQPSRKLLLAGSDFALKPSFVETFGIGPLEAMSQGAVPIYYEDHAYETIMNQERGIPIKRLPSTTVDAYCQYAKNKLELRQDNPFITNSDAVRKVSQRLQESLATALSLPADEWLSKAACSMIYTNREHTWQRIMQERFAPQILEALDRAKQGVTQGSILEQV